MKGNIIILTPVYNDWKNLSKLLIEVNKIFKHQIKTKFELIIVNDRSTEKSNFKNFKLNMVKKVTIISLFKNVGSQRALAIGIRYLASLNKKKFNTIIIDSDGQDNPNAITKILNTSNKAPSSSVAINRGQRKEQLWFKAFYELYCFLIIIFSFKKIRFGNYSLLKSNDLKDLNLQDDLWSAYPPVFSRTIKSIRHLSIDREKRFGGKSKMNFFGLVLHALKVFSVLRYRVLTISFLYSLITYNFLIDKNIFLFLLVNSMLLFLNLANFAISFQNKKKFSENFNKIKIKTIF